MAMIIRSSWWECVLVVKLSFVLAYFQIHTLSV